MNGAAEAPLAALQLPASGQPTEQFCAELRQALHKATWAGVHATAQVLPAPLLQTLVQAATSLLSKEPTLVEIQPSASQQRVTVVGDTHGQFHDVCRLLELFGAPSADRIYVFNGDYVDRGAWGVEVLVLLLAFKLALPRNVYLLRGNHESLIITQVYGFYAELKAKYGPAAKGLFMHIRRMFAVLPLAALVEGSTLILHGGLFRAPPAKAKAGAKRRRSVADVKLQVGTLDDLRKASKGAQDPDPDRSIKNLVASDVMWSDPVNAPGLRANEARGCGTVFGPDVTEAFLAANSLKLIIRSHEGPDARVKRPEEDSMPPVDSGYAVDHDTTSGRLVTLFSSPDYPQFLPEGEERVTNRGAVLHLSAPDYATPEVEGFDAVLPRPAVESYYDLGGYSDDDDEEEEEEGGEGGSQGGSEGKPSSSSGKAAKGQQQPEQQDPSGAAAGEGDTASAATAGAAAAAPGGGASLGSAGAAAAQQLGGVGTAAQLPKAAPAAAGGVDPPDAQEPLSGSNSPHTGDTGGAQRQADDGGGAAPAVSEPGAGMGSGTATAAAAAAAAAAADASGVVEQLALGQSPQEGEQQQQQGVAATPLEEEDPERPSKRQKLQPPSVTAPAVAPAPAQL